MQKESESIRWLLGADPKSELWINESSVSGSHCELIRLDDGYWLNDLGSDNGTFVNDQRFSSGPVTPRDKIQLADRVPMPWPDKKLAKQVITIGSSPENDVHLDHPSVSPRHAELMVDANDLLVIQSCDGRGVVKVDGKEIKAASVSRETSVLLGNVRISPALILRHAAAGTGNASETTRRLRNLAVAGISVVALSLVILLGAAWTLIGIAQTKASNDQVQSPPRQNEQLDAPESVGAAQSEPTDSLVDPIQPKSGLARVRDAMFILLVDSEGQKVEVASAWAARENLLVTSATIVKSINDQELEATAIHGPSKTPYRVVASGLHPDFLPRRQALIELHERRAQLQSQPLQNQPPQSQPPTEAPDVDPGLGVVLRQLPIAIRDFDSVDVGWLKIDCDPEKPSFMGLLDAPTSIRIESGTMLKIAAASIIADINYAEYSPTGRELQLKNVQATEPVLLQDENLPIRWHAKFVGNDYQEYLHTGSPVVDLRGGLVGMYRGCKRSKDPKIEDFVQDGPCTIPEFDMIESSTIDDLLRQISPSKSDDQ
ncbi:MAG: FHA domain-containing protein [Planctomycetota bacterium]